MKSSVSKTVLSMGIVVVLVTGLMFSFSPGIEACGWGNNSGGQGYVPQRQDGRFQSFRPGITKEQATEIVGQQVKKLNPALKVGTVNDAGVVFEAEILSQKNELVQVLGVDKQTGKISLVN